MADLTKLQGEWTIDSLEVDGSEMPVPPGSRIVIHGDRFESLGMGAIYEGAIEIDEAESPKRFDLVFNAGPEKGNRSLGIYELDGDWWQICFTVTGKRRPSAFSTKQGSGLALERLTRGTPPGDETQEITESTPMEPA